MYHTIRRTLAIWTAGIVTSGGGSAFATGFNLPSQDAFASARGEAFVATADNPSAIYYNPAGISQLSGHNVRGGIYGLDLGVKYRSPSGGNFENTNPWHAIPQFFYTYGAEKRPVAFGLGVYSPFGLSMNWPQDTGFRTVATKGSLTYLTINPVVAWQILPNLSIAAGLMANYAEADLRQGLVWPTQAADEFRFKGNAWDLGYNLGVLWKPCSTIALGATFRSTSKLDLRGHTEYFNTTAYGPVPAFPTQRVDAKGAFPFPLEAVLGISYRPTPAWNLEFNAEYTGWDRLGTIAIRQTSAFPPLLPQDVPLTLNWESSWYYEFGATRYIGNGWQVSAGYIYNENSVPDAHYTPLVTDLDRHFFSLGAGHKGEHLTVDLAYQLGYGPPRTVTGSAPSATGQTADGRYEFLSHALILSVGWHF